VAVKSAFGDDLRKTGYAVVIAFDRFGPEKHVRKALDTAWRFSEGRPLSAQHLLQGALVVAQTERSRAFSRFTELVDLPRPLEAPVAATKVRLPPLDVSATPVVRPLADACAIAEPFLLDGKRLWGVDFLTLALLARDDPSLDQFSQEFGVDVDALRQSWLDFVRTSDTHRSPEDWMRWYAMSGFEDTNTTVRPAYLFTWNPDLYAFDSLESHAAEIRESGTTVLRWSTGNRRDVARGARVFLLRQGVEPRGVVGVGEVVGDLVEEPHWDPEQRRKGRKTYLVDVAWQALAREPLLDRSRLVDETGETSLWSTPAGGITIPPEIAQTLESAWQGAWARAERGLSGDHLPDLPDRRLIAALDPDTGGRRIDSMNIDRHVDSFARVIASRSLMPPLSIGLFGDWGSGKTFFMERLEERIDALAQEGRADSSLYWPKICQIKFNAWHYAETDLWASLVSKIFDALRQYLDGDDDEADTFNRLLKELEVAGELRKEAEAYLEQAKSARAEAQEAVADATRKLHALPEPPQPTDAELRKVLAQSIREALPSDAGGLAELMDEAARWSGRSDFSAAADALRSGEQTVEDARRLLGEANAFSGRIDFWWRLLSSARLHRTSGFWLIVAVLVLIPVGALTVQARFPTLGAWAHLWAALAELLTAAGASIAWVRSRLAHAGPVFDRLDALQRRIETRIEHARTADRSAYEYAQATAQREEAEARARLEAAEHALAQARKEEAEARERLEQSTSQARLGRFIRERAASADYEKHLGLIAMIHRDFERLSKLMQKAQEVEPDPERRPVDRIILFIDDLDRCHPPQRVVRVLEAVHLLLFFPLFVVVVGVDSRWVSRALYKHYEEMLADESIVATDGQGDRVLSRAPADSQDFLEKIFQVPFWLRRMEPGAVKRMIHDLISVEEIEAIAPEDAPVPIDEGDEALAGAMQDPESPGQDHADAALEAAPQGDQDAGRAAAKRAVMEAEADPRTLGEALAAPTETLKISQTELEYMDAVAPLMPRTPRSVKRFVNIYRLYKAALSTPGLAHFLGTPERPGNFRAVQVLLALVTGTPRLAKGVFDQLRGQALQDDDPLSELVKRLRGDSNNPDTGDEGYEDPVWRTTLAALDAFAVAHPEITCADLREVSPLVSRYSVHHMVSAAPGQADLG
jgi:hypothetical protein